jgi:hypothetical protein
MAYQSAACVPPLPRPPDKPVAVLRWDARVPHGAPLVLVSGCAFVGCRIDVEDLKTGSVYEVTPPLDYVYPADVRVAEQSARLYVISDGLAAGLWRETWLVEYDLRRHARVARRRVTSDVLRPCFTETPVGEPPPQ